MPNIFFDHLRAKQLSPRLLSLSQKNRQLRKRKNQNPPQGRLDQQLSNPEPSNHTKNQKISFFPIEDDDDNKNYESSRESFSTSTKEWKSYYE